MGEGLSVGQIVAQLKRPDDIVTEAARAEILHTYGNTVGIVVEQVLKVFPCPLVDDIHRFALALSLALAIGELSLVNLDVVFLGQPAQSLGVGHLLVLHNETDRVTSLATTKTVAGATCWRDNERRSFLIVKRAQSLIVAAAAAQCHKL